MTQKRYIFTMANGKVAFETNGLALMRAARRGAEFMQDRVTGIRYSVAFSGPLIHRLKVIS